MKIDNKPITRKFSKLNFNSDSTLKMYEADFKLYRNKYYKYNGNDDLILLLLDLFENNSLHSTIVNDKVRRIFGSGLLSEDKESQELILTTYNNLINRIMYDKVLFGGCFLYVLWNEDHTKLLTIKHVDYSKARICPDEIFVIKNDWYDAQEKAVYYPKFDASKGTGGEQIYFIKDYSPNKNSIYPLPEYYAGCKAIDTSTRLTTFFNGLIKNNFAFTTIVEVPDIQDDVEKEAFERNFKKSTMGEEKAGSTFLLYKNGAEENKVVVNKLNANITVGGYKEVDDLMECKILHAHGVPSPLLYGISKTGSLGNGTEYQNAEIVYESTTIAPQRNCVMKHFNILNHYLLNPLAPDTYIESISTLTQEKDTENGTDSDVQTTKKI